MIKKTVLIAAISFALISTSVWAGGSSRGSGARPNNDALARRAPEVRGYVFRPGGYSYQYEYEPFLRRNGAYGNYPQFDPRNFQERVFSDPRLNTTSPSAF